MKGLFELKTADDLYAKLRVDYEQLKAAPSDSRNAFNFVVTGWHLLEWRFRKKVERDAMRHRHPVLRVYEHLAVGAKHFQPTCDRHDSVLSSRLSGGWAPGAWTPGVWAKGVWGERLIIEFDCQGAGS